MPDNWTEFVQISLNEHSKHVVATDDLGEGIER